MKSKKIAYTLGEKPTPDLVKEARLAAGLRQDEAAAILHKKTLNRWSEWETGHKQMQPCMFELFLLRTGQIPLQIVTHAK